MIRERTIKYYRIDKKNAGHYGVFDPFGWMQWLVLPNAFAIGALDDAGNTLGIMVCMAGKEALTLLWLAVDAGYQGKGLGEGLLRKAFELMDRGQLPRLRVVLDQAYEMEPFSMNRKSFFTERLFSEEISAAAHWTGTLLELSQLQYYKDSGNEKLKPVLLNDMTGKQIAESLKELIGTQEAKMLYDVSEIMDAVDPRLSCMLIEDGEACGGFLVQRLSRDTLLPVFIYAESGHEADAMIRYSYDRAMELFGGTAFVSAVIWDVTSPAKPTQTEKILLGLAERALPKSAAGSRILSVTRKEYNEFLEKYHPEERRG